MNNLIKYVERFSQKNILVIGDIMVDRFIYGKVTRISPEAPVPVVEITKETNMPGGAANVASNITSVGGNVELIGIIGNDFAGKYLLNLLHTKNVKVSAVTKDNTRPTILKTRVVAHHQQVVRIDREVRGEFPKRKIEILISNFKKSLPYADAVILSDYGKGVICKELLKTVIASCRRKKIPVVVDPKIEHFMSYRGVSCLTPNLQEAKEGIKALRCETEKDVRMIGIKIMKTLKPDSLIITRGEKGMTLFESDGKIKNIPTRAKEVFDVTGAGDTVIAIFTLSLAAGATFYEAAEISNYAAGVVVGKLGTATVTKDELISAIKEG